MVGRRRWSLLGVFALSLSLIAGAVAADGGTSIATAPLLQSGELESGTGAHDQPGGGSSGHDYGKAFWRVQVYAGDAITGSGSESSNGLCGDSMWLYAPTVTDATLDQGKPVLKTPVTHAGGSCDSRTFTWSWLHLPFSGKATLWADFGFGFTFQFKVQVRHRTVLRIAAPPLNLASPHTSITLRATLSSPGGTPTGICGFDRQPQGRGAWHPLVQARVRGGRCSARVQGGSAGYVRFRVRFVPTAGWLASAAATPRILVR